MNKKILRITAFILTAVMLMGFAPLYAPSQAAQEQPEDAQTDEVLPEEAQQEAEQEVQEEVREEVQEEVQQEEAEPEDIQPEEEQPVDEEAEVFLTAKEYARTAEDSGAKFNGYVFKLKDDVMTVLDTDAMEGIDNVEYIDNVYTAAELEQIADALPTEDIEFIEPNYIRHLCRAKDAANDALYKSGQWNLEAMNLPDVWKLGIEGGDMDAAVDMDGNGVADDDKIIVAVIDTGITSNHEDIDYSRVLPGKNFFNPNLSVEDDDGHGTGCAGIIMATKDNDVGVAGICQDVYVLPLRVFEGDDTKDSIIYGAVNYAAEQRELFNEDPSQGMNISVINMSLGGEYTSTIEKNAMNRAKAAGIIVVCAAGNDGDMTESYPAQNAIGVGATMPSGTIAEFSQRLYKGNGEGWENKVWVTAPGASIYVLNADKTKYEIANGTSLASPEVAALAAVCKGIDNTLDHESFKALLKDTAIRTSGDEGSIDGQDIAYGWGKVDFSVTVKALLDKLGKEYDDETEHDYVTVSVVNEDGDPIENAKLMIFGDWRIGETGGQILPDENGVYDLSRPIDYTYEVSAPGYADVRGKIPSTGSHVDIVMKTAIPVTVVVTDNEGGTVENTTLKLYNSAGRWMVKSAVNGYTLYKDTFNYSITAPGYLPTEGSFELQGDEGSYTLNIEMTKLPPETLYIDVQPAYCGVPVGVTASFSVSAGGTGLTYQWQFSRNGETWKDVGSTITGSKEAEMSFTAQQKYDTYQYRCVITDVYGKSITSDAATFRISDGFRITEQPFTLDYTEPGELVNFHVVAVNRLSDRGEPLTYQWQYNASGKWKNIGTSIESAKTSRLIFTAQKKYFGYKYRCVITNCKGEKLISKVVELWGDARVIIKAQPQSVSAKAGSKVSFSVEASGRNLTYQWEYNAGGDWKDVRSSIPSATTDTLTFTALSKYNGYKYRCVIFDEGDDDITTKAATLTVE